MENYFNNLKVCDWESIHTKQWLLDLQKSIRIDNRVLDMIGTLNGKFLLSMEKETFQYFDQINGELLYDSIQNFIPYQIEGDEYIKEVNYYKKFSFKMGELNIKNVKENGQHIDKIKELYFKLVNSKSGGKRIIISDNKLDTKSIGKYLYNLYQTDNNRPVLYVNCKDDFECTNKNLEKSLQSLSTIETNQRLALPSSKRYLSKLIIGLLQNNVNVILNEFHQLDNIPNMMGYFQQDFDSIGALVQNGTLFVLSSDEKKMTHLFSNARPLILWSFSIFNYLLRMLY
ncbi:hypothetical protein ACTFIR_007212 [Dictyostelium discoideum]